MDAELLLVGAMPQHLQDVVFVVALNFALEIAAEIVVFDVTIHLPESGVRLAISFATLPTEVVVDWHLFPILWFDEHVLWWHPALSLPLVRLHWRFGAFALRFRGLRSRFSGRWLFLLRFTHQGFLVLDRRLKLRF